MPATSLTDISLNGLIPMPVDVHPAVGVFRLNPDIQILVSPGTEDLLALGQYLAERLRPATGYALPVQVAEGSPVEGNLLLTTLEEDPALGEEGYVLEITPDFFRLSAYRPAGLFYGIQTLRQLLPPEIENDQTLPGTWEIAAVQIRDMPRFSWRGAMLDVARHFFGMEDVKRLIDEMAYYKLNRLHLHLSDDQGWRLMIENWPRLATYGGELEVGGGLGGYYTQADYVEIVAYAHSRFILIVPEIDMPGHTNAALASYPELNCGGVAPKRYTDTGVGFSSLCISKEITYQFIEDVVRELAALTPGPYIHIGGDEAHATEHADYILFIEKVQAIVQAHGKQAVGWEDIAQARLLETSVAQHWHSDDALKAVQQGAKLILSPSAKTYLDMKYDKSTKLGLDWAGTTDVQDAYNWEPATWLAGVGEQDILGVEAPLWSETVLTMGDIEYLIFPRLIGLAEIGWSPATGRNWEEYRQRLGSHGPRLTLMQVNFYADPGVPWR